MTYTTRRCRADAEAEYVAWLLASFDPPIETWVRGPVTAVTADGRTRQWWEVSIVLPATTDRGSPPGQFTDADPLDLDETTDYVDTHWDREADDRDEWERRHGQY